jgi:hypothetical protein
MKKVTTSNNRTVFINPNGLCTANAFLSTEKQEAWISLDYGKRDPQGKSINVLVGPFQTIELANSTIETLI